MLKETKLAQSVYEKSIEINSGRRTARLKLIKILEKTDKERASHEQEALEYITSFYEGL